MVGIFAGWAQDFAQRLAHFLGISVADSAEEREPDIDRMDPIDISSDSDIEIQEPVGRQANPRPNPPWLTAGNNGYSQQGSPQKSYVPNGSSSNTNNHAKVRPTHSTSTNGIEASHRISRPDDTSYLTGNGNFVNSRIGNISGADYERLSSQQALKRTLPPSLSASASASRSDGYLGYGNGSRMRDAYSNPPSTSSNSMIRGINGSRILPSSLTYGMPASSSHYAGSTDTTHRFGLGEERLPGNDERLIYQAALEDLNQPKVEYTPPAGLLSVTLLRHQKIALAWMLQKETRSLHCLGGILADDQGLGKTVSMIALILVQKLLESKNKSENLSNHKTEALNLDDDDDDNGNAKHGGSNDIKLVSEPASKYLNNRETKPSNVDDNNENGSLGWEKVKNEEWDSVKSAEEAGPSTRSFSRKRPAAGTLVVCPASVLRQWARELDEKVTDEAKLSVLVYHGGSRTKDPVELAKYDVVMTTYAIVTNEVPKQPMVDEDELDEKNVEKYGLSSSAFPAKKRKNASSTGKKGKKRGRKRMDDSSYDDDCGPLARVGWFRVILDEAQTIKNHRTQVARACCSLRAKRRWCLSGTPIQNTIDDLYSYFRFLKYDPYAIYKSFYHTIKVQISRNSLHGYKKLQAVLRAIMLRRTKGTLIDGEPIIRLPPKSIRLTKVDFSAEERAFYRQLEADSRSQFKAYAAAGTVNQNYANILLMLLRLRQACDHPLLVKGYNSDPIGKVFAEAAKRLPREAHINLLSCLEKSSAICCVCNDPPEDPVVTLCGHVFCYQCVSEYLTGDDNMCPVPKCKEQLGHDVVFSESTLRSSIADEDDDSIHDHSTDKSIVQQSEYSSSKIRAVLAILQSHSKPRVPNSEPPGSSEFDQMPSSSEPCDFPDVTVVKRTTVYSTLPVEGPIKTIVFSQWTGMLDLVEMSLNENCLQYRRLDGTMSLAARDRAVKDFSNDPEVTVMLMSLKAGNLGLNMVAACHVILLDLWWNPTTEDQAVDRAHRIGQTRPVTVTRLTIKDTVEDRILALQEEKRKMVASAFGEDQGGSSASRLTVDDLKYLFMV